jgi:hypothetical protein
MVISAYSAQAAWLGEDASARAILDIADVDAASESGLARLTPNALDAVFFAGCGKHLRDDLITLGLDWRAARAAGADRGRLHIRMAALAALSASSVPANPACAWAVATAVKLRRIAERWAAMAPGPDGGERVPDFVAAEAVSVIVTAPPDDAQRTEIQGLPVFSSLADLRQHTGGTKQEWQGLVTGRYHYEVYSGPRGRAWLATPFGSKPAPKQRRPPTGGFQVAA